jgi:parvulin-like peptidyl-prolyl isomerase
VNPFFKALVGIVVVAVLAGLGIVYQFKASSMSGGQVGLTRDELNLFVEKNMGFRERTELASNPEARKKFLEQLKKQLALAAEAQRRGLDQSEAAKAVNELTAAQVLQGAYMTAHPELAKGSPRGPQASPEEVKAWVDTHQTEVARYQAAVSERAHGMPAPKPEDFASAFVFAEKARQEKLDAKPETQLQLKLQHYSYLIETLAEQLEKETEYKEEEVRAYYDQNKDTGGLDKVHAQHILFATVVMPSPENPMGGGPAPDKTAQKQLADQVLARVKAGEDFGELAKQYSNDPGSKDKGGDLGMSERYQFVKAFDDVAWALQPGQVSDVVESEFGYHIIKVIERQPPGELTPELLNKLKETLSQKRFEETVEEIARRNPVSVPEDFEVTAPPPQAMPQMPGFDPHGEMPEELELEEAPPGAPGEQ